MPSRAAVTARFHGTRWVMTDRLGVEGYVDRYGVPLVPHWYNSRAARLTTHDRGLYTGRTHGRISRTPQSLTVSASLSGGPISADPESIRRRCNRMLLDKTPWEPVQKHIGTRLQVSTGLCQIRPVYRRSRILSTFESLFIDSHSRKIIKSTYSWSSELADG